MHEIRVFSPDEWRVLARQAHLVVFGEDRSPELERHQFATVVTYNGELGGYFTCHEMDKETVYIQYGGVFPTFQKSLYVAPGYRKMMEWFLARYKRVNTRIENKNISMLKLALSAGYLITGTSLFKDKLFLELSLEVL